MQLPTGLSDSCKLIISVKNRMLKIFINFFLFGIQVQQKQSEEMIREIERLFESLKDDFNEKVGNFSYFTKINDPIENHIANAGGSISDSFEDISMGGDICQEENFKSKILVFTDLESKSISIVKPASEILTDESPIEKSEKNIDTSDRNIHEIDCTENIPIKSDACDENTLKESLTSSIDENENDGNENDENDVISEKDNTSLKQPDEIDEDLTIKINEDESENILLTDKPVETVIEIAQSNIALENDTILLIGEDKDIRILTNSDETLNIKYENTLIENEKRDDREIIEHLYDNEELTNLSESDENEKNNEIFLCENLVGKNDNFDDYKSDFRSINNEIHIEESKINDNQLNSFVKKPEDLNYIEIPVSKSLDQLNEKENLKRIENENKSYESARVRKSSLNNINRRMWSEMPEVMNSGILKKISKKMLQYQEAMFEIITSEASYYQSLMILTKHFFQSDLFSTSENKETIVSATDKHHIFSNVILIMKTSNNLLNDLQQRWHEEKPIMSDICDIILNHVVSDDFQSYVTYLRNQQYQTQALKRLSENESFKQQLSKLESSSECGKLSLDSYLMLPMQRLTRLKLLVEAVSKLHNSEELTYKISESIKNKALEALEEIKQLLNTSNTEKGLMDQKSALISLINRIEFPPNFKRITFSDKILIREEELRVHQQTQLKTLRKISKKNKPSLTLLLFNDFLIITKKKNGKLLVLDYCNTKDIKAESASFKRHVSSNEASSNTSTIDVSTESSSPNRIIGTTLIRSKTSLSGDERKRLSVPINNAFTSMPSINKNEVQETKHQTFILKFSKSDIFTDPLHLITQSREDRDLWLSYFNENDLEDQCDAPLKQNYSRLQKSTSLKIKTNYSDSLPISKTQSFKKQNDDITDEILTQSEIAQDWNDEFLMVRANEIGFMLSF